MHEKYKDRVELYQKNIIDALQKSFTRFANNAREEVKRIEERQNKLTEKCQKFQEIFDSGEYELKNLYLKSLEIEKKLKKTIKEAKEFLAMIPIEKRQLLRIIDILESENE